MVAGNLSIRRLDFTCSNLRVEWDRLVQDNTASGIMQSSAWRELKERQGLPTLHLGIFHSEKLVAGCIFYSSNKEKRLGLLAAPEGPVLPWENSELSRECLRLIIDAARTYASEVGAIAMRVEPRLVPPPPSILREFSRGPMDLVPHETLYINLAEDIAAIQGQMKPKGRYNIRVAERHGVRVKEDLSPLAAGRFYSIVKEASERDGFSLEPLSFFENMATVLCAHGMARFLFAEHEGEVLGTMLLSTFGTRATYLYGGVSNRKRNLMGGYALQWAAMQKAKEMGCTIYDFYGFDEFRSPGHSYARFSQFKSQFGGTPMRFIGAQDYFFIDNLADAFIRVVNEATEQLQT